MATHSLPRGLSCLPFVFSLFLLFLSLYAMYGEAVTPTIRVHSSIQNTHARLTQLTPIPFTKSKSVNADYVLSLYPKKQYQRILGFGGAITDSATYVMSHLPKPLQQEILEAYYGPNGNKYNIGRIHMNSCDFSPKSYSFAETPWDYDLEHFDLGVSHDAELMIPFAKKAAALSEKANRGHKMKLFFTPWSPPAWMKTNQQMTSSFMPCLIEDPRIHRAWALYYVKFMRAYKKHGIDFWGLTVQNEPEFAAPWEACVQTAEQHRDFVRDYLGPTITNSEFNKTKIMIYDHNKDDMKVFADIIYTDPEAAKYIYGMAIHWYSGDQFENVAAVNEKYPQFKIFGSEACNCPGVLLDDWQRGEKYAHDIIGDLNNGVVGWTDWNIVLDQNGGPNHLNNFCDAPVIALLNENPPRVHYQPAYYMMGHFSRFLPAGAVRIGHSFQSISHNTHSPIELTTFLVEGDDTESGKPEIVVIVFNPSDDSSSFKLDLGPKQGLAAKVDMPPHSVSTLIFDAALLA